MENINEQIVSKADQRLSEKVNYYDNNQTSIHTSQAGSFSKEFSKDLDQNGIADKINLKFNEIIKEVAKDKINADVNPSFDHFSFRDKKENEIIKMAENAGLNTENVLNQFRKNVNDAEKQIIINPSSEFSYKIQDNRSASEINEKLISNKDFQDISKEIKTNPALYAENEEFRAKVDTKVQNLAEMLYVPLRQVYDAVLSRNFNDNGINPDNKMTEKNTYIRENNLPMYFEAKDIPYEQFEKYFNMSKRDVLTKDKEFLDNLLSGIRTPLERFSMPQLNGATIDAKLSLKRMSDGSVGLFVHPVKKDIENDINLSKQDIEKLKQNQTVIANIKSENGVIKPHVVQRDPDTNELLRLRVEALNKPDKIAGITLSNEQAEKISKGNDITISDGKNNFNVKIDLNSSRGYSVYNQEGINQNSKLSNDLKEFKADSNSMSKGNEMKR